MKQKDLSVSGHQAHWLEKISEFDFKIEYVPGVENVLADALSRICSNDSLGTVWAASEYMQYDDSEDLPCLLVSCIVSMPVYMEMEVMVA
ncbi:uncharacterized protein LAESUDRAFT_666049, partial [Laetiporus sulphureus 93-53]